jgi:hypothetical protein
MSNRHSTVVASPPDYTVYSGSSLLHGDVVEDVVLLVSGLLQSEGWHQLIWNKFKSRGIGSVMKNNLLKNKAKTIFC